MKSALSIIPFMESNPKKIFWEKCKGPLDERKISRVAEVAGIPEKSLRQFYRNGYLGDKNRDKLSKYLFNVERWIDAAVGEQQAEKPRLQIVERRTSAMDVDRILIALGELKADWNSRFDRLEQRVSELEKRPFPSGRAR